MIVGIMTHVDVSMPQIPTCYKNRYPPLKKKDTSMFLLFSRRNKMPAPVVNVRAMVKARLRIFLLNKNFI